MDKESILKYWLPTKLSRLVAVAVLPIAIGGFALVGYLRPLLSFWEEETITMFQVVVFLILVLVGAVILLISLIIHIKNMDVNVTVKLVEPDNRFERKDLL